MRLLTSYRQHLNLKQSFKSVFIRSADQAAGTQLAALDGVRAIAILLVMLLHSVVGGTRLLDEEQITTYISNLPNWLDIAWQARGSDLIFVLCGLLVSMSLLRQYDCHNSFQVWSFYKQRVIRIYPLFFTAVVLYLLADSDRSIYLLSNLLFATNLWPEQKNIVPVGWSMNIQMQFYLLLPWLLISMLWLKSRTSTVSRIFLVLMAAVIVLLTRYVWIVTDQEFAATPFYEFFNEDSGYDDMYAQRLYYNLSTRIGPFLMGTLAACIFHFSKPALTARPWVINVCLIVGIVLMYAACSVGIHDRFDSFYQPFNESLNIWYLTGNKYLFSLGATLVIMSILVPTGLARPLVWVFSLAVWRPIAKLIYPLYLFHVPFIIVAAVLVLGTTDEALVTSISLLQILGVFLVTVVLSCMFSLFMHLFIENPFINMQRVRKGDAAKATSPN